jgi:hypothetical protein
MSSVILVENKELSTLLRLLYKVFHRQNRAILSFLLKLKDEIVDKIPLRIVTGNYNLL